MRCVIAEGETLSRAGLTLVLKQGDFDIVAAAADAHEQLLALVREHAPDLVVTTTLRRRVGLGLASRQVITPLQNDNDWMRISVSPAGRP